MDGNRRDSGCRPFFAHAVIRNMSGERRVFTDECDESTTCPVEGGFSRISDSNDRVTQNDNLSGERRVFTDESHQNTTCPVEGGFSRTFLKNLPTAPTYWR